MRISDEVGLGVVASRHIPRGTLVWVQDRFDRVVPRAEGQVFDAHHRAVLDRWAHLDAERNWVLCWDAGRLVNHSCEPTLRGVGPTVMVARCELRPGDEVTCDYAECNIEFALKCSCGSEGCRGVVVGTDLLRFADQWDVEVQELLDAARKVPQPLLRFAIDRDEFEAQLAGLRPVPSFVAQSPPRLNSADSPKKVLRTS